MNFGWWGGEVDRVGGLEECIGAWVGGEHSFGLMCGECARVRRLVDPVLFRALPRSRPHCWHEGRKGRSISAPLAPLYCMPDVSVGLIIACLCTVYCVLDTDTD